MMAQPKESFAMIITAILSALPHSSPACENARIALFAIRRLGGHGLMDANAAQTFVIAFGKGFRRPLTLARAMMADLARTSTVSIPVAPCCCPRMTASEQALLTILSRVEHNRESASLLMADLLGQRRIDGVLASVAALAVAFADEGRPVCM
jgi:hypothetical protein